jgi:uncharacterized protein (DUF983 family)
MKTTQSGHSAARMLGRALRRRCPVCGGDDIFRSYMTQRESCPGCGLLLDRGERDFFIGAYTINLIVAELIVFVGGIGVLVGTWPNVPWTALTYGLVTLMVLAPIVLYPYSRQAWLACDLVFRSAESTDFCTTSSAGHPAAGPSSPPQRSVAKMHGDAKIPAGTS